MPSPLNPYSTQNVRPFSDDSRVRVILAFQHASSSRCYLKRRSLAGCVLLPFMSWPVVGVLPALLTEPYLPLS